MLINGGEHKSQGWLERRPGPVMYAMGHVNSVEVRTRSRLVGTKTSQEEPVSFFCQCGHA